MPGLSNLKRATLEFVEMSSTFESSTSSDNLSDKLCEFGLITQSVSPDGNCFLNSVALNLILGMWDT